MQRFDQARAVAQPHDDGIEALHVDLGLRGCGGGRGRRRVERQLGDLGAVVDLDAVGGAGALAERAGVALERAVARAGQVEQTLATRLAEELALLEVDALEDLVQA